MPKHGVPLLLLSDNGPQFTASVIRDFCENVGARKIYSTPYHPQGNSIVESYMRSLKKSLSALVSEDGREWDLFLAAVALAYNSTPHTATGYSPFFLTHGREAILPVQRYLDEPRLDLESRRWLSRLWKSRVYVYERHAAHASACKEWVENSNAMLPIGTIVAVKLNPQDKTDYSSKLGPLYMGPWVVVERFTNGKTYRVRDLTTEQERQVARDQIKVLDIPSAWGEKESEVEKPLPRVSRVELGEGVIAHRHVCAGEASKEANASPAEPSTDSGENNNNTRKRIGDEQQVTREEVHAQESPKHRDHVPRYSLRQVPERLALQAEKRRRSGCAN